MGKRWNGIRRRIASVLIGTLVLTCLSPAAGWARTFREMVIADEDAGVDGIISADVKAGFDSKSNQVTMGLGETVTEEYTFKLDVGVKVATASEATTPNASPTMASVASDNESNQEGSSGITEAEAKELVASWLEYGVTVTGGLEDVPVRVQAEVPNEDPLKVKLTITAPEDAAYYGKAWSGNVTLTPSLKAGHPFGVDVVSITSAQMALTVGLTGDVSEAAITPDRNEISLTSGGESKSLTVQYSPADAAVTAVGMVRNADGELVESDSVYFQVDGYEDVADAMPAKTIITLSGLQETVDEELYLRLSLVVGSTTIKSVDIRVYVVRPQLDLPEDADAGALMDAMASQLEDLKNSGATQGEILQAADEVIAALQEIDPEELIEKEGNLQEVEAALQNLLGTKVEPDNKASSQVASIESTGGLLNVAPGQNGTLKVEPAPIPSNTNGLQNLIPLEIKLVDSNGNAISELKVPMKLTFGKVTGLDYARPIRIRHFREDGSVQDIKPIVRDGKLTIWVDGYSTFLFANTKTNNSYQGGNGSSGGGGGGAAPTSSGSWQQDANGWKYRYSSGTYAINGWAELSYNGRTDWYHFNLQGYLDSGWYKENGITYYLSPVHDGTFGMMATGWKEIEGKSYYFNPLTGGPKGAMLVNTVTPDGKTVGADGAMILK